MAPSIREELERSPPREESGACSREAGRGSGRSP